MRALVGELVESRYGAAVRLETAHDCPVELADYLLKHFRLEQTDLYRVSGPVNLNRLMAIYALVDRPDLKYGDFTPGVPAQLVNQNIFEAIARQDILLHHPFESFAPVVDFVYRAANDPDVLAIKQTLYRTTADSPIVESLVSAARAGKEVTALVELLARFDEAANIELASKLQQAGAHVVYGVVGYKTHCKMILVVRRENNGLRRYVHLGTGNYHPGTARAYTDYGLFTANEQISEDVHQVFMQLTSLMKTSRLNLIAQSPFNLHQQLIDKIRREIENVRAGGNGHIIAELTRGTRDHRNPLQRIAGRRHHRSHRPRALLPAPGRAWFVGQHPRTFDHRPLPRTYAMLLLSQRRRCRSVLRKRGLDGP
jgi:polyphosphate kinase